MMVIECKALPWADCSLALLSHFRAYMKYAPTTNHFNFQSSILIFQSSIFNGIVPLTTF